MSKLPIKFFIAMMAICYSLNHITMKLIKNRNELLETEIFIYKPSGMVYPLMLMRVTFLFYFLNFSCKKICKRRSKEQSRKKFEFD